MCIRDRIKASEREKILSAENAYKILLSVFDSETIQYKEFFKVILMNRANKVLGVCHISEGEMCIRDSRIGLCLLPAFYHFLQLLSVHHFQTEDKRFTI